MIQVQQGDEIPVAVAWEDQAGPGLPFKLTELLLYFHEKVKARVLRVYTFAVFYNVFAETSTYCSPRKLDGPFVSVAIFISPPFAERC